MSKPVSAMTTWASQTSGNTSDLDSNFSKHQTALNDLGTYSNYTATDTGSANTYTPQYSSSLSGALAAGLCIQFLPAATNTGASTCNPTVGGSALGSKSIKNLDGTALTYGQIVANGIANLMYDGTQWLLLNPAFRAGQQVLIQQNTPSAAATSVFDNTVSAAYSLYVIEFVALTVATDQEDIRIQVGTTATPTYQTSAYQYSKMGGGTTAAAVSTETSAAGSDNVTSSIVTGRLQGNAGAIGNAAGESFSGTIKIYNPASATNYKHIGWHIVYTDSSGNLEYYTGGGMWKSATAVTSFKVLTGTTGNMTGTINLYGIRN